MVVGWFKKVVENVGPKVEVIVVWDVCEKVVIDLVGDTVESVVEVLGFGSLGAEVLWGVGWGVVEEAEVVALVIFLDTFVVVVWTERVVVGGLDLVLSEACCFVVTVVGEVDTG